MTAVPVAFGARHLNKFRWYAGKDYATLLHADTALRAHLRKKLHLINLMPHEIPILLTLWQVRCRVFKYLDSLLLSLEHQRFVSVV